MFVPLNRRYLFCIQAVWAVAVFAVVLLLPTELNDDEQMRNCHADEDEDADHNSQLSDESGVAVSSKFHSTLFVGLTVAHALIMAACFIMLIGI